MYLMDADTFCSYSPTQEKIERSSMIKSIDPVQQLFIYWTPKWSQTVPINKQQLKVTAAKAVNLLWRCCEGQFKCNQQVIHLIDTRSHHNAASETDCAKRKVVSELAQRVGWEKGNVMSPTLHLPLFYSKQLDRSAVIGCTSSTWAALPFLAVPNGAANSMLLAGWQTGRWEPANGRLDETQAPVYCIMGSLQPAAD